MTRIQYLVPALALGALATATGSSASEVVLIGDPVRFELVQKLAGAKMQGAFAVAHANGARFSAPRRGAALTAIADRLYASRRAVLVVDATQGPVPIIREHALLARQASARIEGVYFAHAGQLMSDGQADLLQLEHDEVREVLEFYDHTTAGISFVNGPARLQRALDGSPSRAPQPPASPSPARARAGSLPLLLYFLTPDESPGTRAHRPRETLQLWVGGETRRVIFPSKLVPGDNGEHVVRVVPPVPAAPGDRCFVAHDGHLRGVCAVMEPEAR
ncbi:MAG: hypothetical protein MJE66_24075 [Proteobacteria bacterium]|nr:hypothetical protein [Pseudomonadota bacterium]